MSAMTLRDPWGRPYYATFKQSAVYGNRVTIFSYATYGQKAKEKTELTPVTQRINYIYLRRNAARMARKARPTISTSRLFRA